jgi:enoyl-CoA hydratase
MAGYSTLAVRRDSDHPRVLRISLNRPTRLNALTPALLSGAQAARVMCVPVIDLASCARARSCTFACAELQRAVEVAGADPETHVIVLDGARQPCALRPFHDASGRPIDRSRACAGVGRAFSAGYDLQEFGSGRASHACQQEAVPWEPTEDYAAMRECTNAIMSLWRSRVPTVAMVRGVALAGGSDVALACDLLVMADDASIGYPPSRVWGCPTTAMWAFRVGSMRAKQLLFTGQMLSGRTAAEWGLATMAVPAAELETATLALARRIAGVPRSHLAMHKLVVNQAVLAQGLEQSQTLATFFDGVTRHNPEGLWFRRYAQVHGFKSAVEWRDSGRPIPEGDDARARIRELEALLKAREAGGNGTAHVPRSAL